MSTRADARPDDLYIVSEEDRSRALSFWKGPGYGMQSILCIAYFMAKLRLAEERIKELERGN